MKAPDNLLDRLGAWETEDDKHWGEWRKDAKQSFAFVASDQWSKDERSEAVDGGRLVTTINRIGPMINAVAGAEIIDRQQVQYSPRTTGDAAVNEILTMGAEWIRDRTMADREESDAFRDTLICGLGYTETRMDYDDEIEGKIVIERIDPLEIIPDAAARKSNLRDARRLRRKKRIGKDEFKLAWPDATMEDEAHAYASGVSGRPARKAYKNPENDEDPLADDEVEVSEWQWFEYTFVWVTKGPDGQYVELTDEMKKEGEKLGVLGQTVRQKRKKFYRAVACNGQVLEYDPLPDNEFRWKTITGERNRNKGTFYGIVEAMKDPQRFANLFFSMLHHIIRTNAKGGIMAELEAFDNPEQAQESWARSDSISWMAPNGLTKVKEKPAPDIPPQITQLLQVAISGIQDASGINEELLGMVDRNQPGILEHQRKQAAYAILAGYYDSLKFYRVDQGGLLLKYIQKYLPDGYLVRIAGEDGDPRYVPLTKQPETIKFDVVVDDAPDGPNQKEKVWGMITNMQPILANAGPEVWAELVDYSPFPDKVNKSLKQIFQSQGQEPGEGAVEQAPPLTPIDVMEAQTKARESEAKASKDESVAEKNRVETALMLQGPGLFAPIQA